MGANEKREATFHGSDDAARHGIVNAIHRGILGGFTNLCSCGASIIEPDGGHESTDAHLAGPPSPPRKPRTYRQGYADGKAWQAAQPVAEVDRLQGAIAKLAPAAFETLPDLQDRIDRALAVLDELTQPGDRVNRLRVILTGADS